MRHTRKQWPPADVTALRDAVENEPAHEDGPRFWRSIMRSTGIPGPWQRLQIKAYRLGLRANIKPGSRSASRWHS